MTDVVAQLLDVEEGDRVKLIAEHKHWTKPFEVAAIEEERWLGADGDDWVARELTLTNSDGRMPDRVFSVAEGEDPPFVTAQYGHLASVELVGDEPDEDDVDQEGSDEPVTGDRVERVADQYRRLEDVAAELGVTIGRARVLTHQYGCYSDLVEARDRGRMAVYDGLLVMILGLTVIGAWGIAVILAGGL